MSDRKPPEEAFKPAKTPRDSAGQPQVVPIDAAGSDWVSLFASEFAPESKSAQLAQVERHPALRVSVLTDDPHHHEPKADDPPPVVTSRFGWRNMSLALLAIVVLAQAGVMAYWILTRGTAAPPMTGSVTVTSEPSEAPVTIDGKARGSTPVTVALEPGSHSVAVGVGDQLRTQLVNVTRGGENSMHVELAKAPALGLPAGTGGVQVTTDPVGARVWIDGEPRGVAPVTVPGLTPGDHLVTVRASNETVNRTVTVQEAAVASLIISMSGTGAFASGWLAITSGVPMQILEKGTVVGTTDTPRILLPAGAHELELVNESLGYRVTRSVQITAGQTTSVGLKPPMGTLSINALPWAEVWIDGQRAGETPIGNLSIVIGEHDVRFRHPELAEQRKTVIVGAGAPVRVGVDMRKP